HDVEIVELSLPREVEAAAVGRDPARLTRNIRNGSGGAEDRLLGRPNGFVQGPAGREIHGPHVAIEDQGTPVPASDEAKLLDRGRRAEPPVHRNRSIDLEVGPAVARGGEKPQLAPVVTHEGGVVVEGAVWAGIPAQY